MNKKIDKKFAKKLDENVSEKFLIGSRLWGTNTEKSDYDYVAVYDHKTDNEIDLLKVLHINHVFQYDSEINGKKEQTIYYERNQFFRSIIKGDSLVAFETLLIYWQFLLPNLKSDDIVKFSKSYKILKMLLGYTKRDLKNGKRYLKFARKQLYIVEKLLKDELPSLSDISELMKYDVDDKTMLYGKMVVLRNTVREMYNNDELKLYGLDSGFFKTNDDIVNNTIELANIKEFRYE